MNRRGGRGGGWGGGGGMVIRSFCFLMWLGFFLETLEAVRIPSAALIKSACL